MTEYLDEWLPVEINDSYAVEIWITGDYKQIKNVCGQYAQEAGTRFVVQEVDFVRQNDHPIFECDNLLHSSRSGVKITLNDHRIRPGTKLRLAEVLAQRIALECQRGCYTIVTPLKTFYFTRRKDDV